MRASPLIRRTVLSISACLLLEAVQQPPLAHHGAYVDVCITFAHHGGRSAMRAPLWCAVLALLALQGAAILFDLSPAAPNMCLGDEYYEGHIITVKYNVPDDTDSWDTTITVRALFRPASNSFCHFHLFLTIWNRVSCPWKAWRSVLGPRWRVDVAHCYLFPLTLLLASL